MRNVFIFLLCFNRLFKKEKKNSARFPTDERVKVHWLKNMGRVNWNPSTESRLCSAHFFKDCIDFRDKVARLRKGSIPTIFDGKMMNTFPSQHNIIFMEEYIASRKIVKGGTQFSYVYDLKSWAYV